MATIVAPSLPKRFRDHGEDCQDRRRAGRTPRASGQRTARHPGISFTRGALGTTKAALSHRHRRIFAE